MPANVRLRQTKAPTSETRGLSGQLFMRQVQCIVAALLLMAVVTGCSSRREPEIIETHPITGTVTYRGKPLANILVIFHPAKGQGRPGASRTDANGHFPCPTTHRESDGVIPGQHTVTIANLQPTVADSAVATSSTGGSTPQVKFPAKYEEVATSPLKVDVAQPDQVVEFELKD
ncbi:MAG: hypothetical protein KDA62_21425 [Planctomycetales bacterium]|nr:hypothetical protein [Planctomycetales bacterium]